jgi:Xaa-Pro aminopeptidase
LDKKEFARRRRAIMEEMGEGSIAILPAAPVRERNRDVEYPYRQDSDFYYVTGYEEPEAVAVLLPKRKRGEFVLFCRERDPEMELWNGKRSGLEGACADYGADDAFPIGDIDDILPGLLENQSRVYYAMGYYSEFDQRMIGWVNRVRTRSNAGVTSPAEFVALDNLLHEMRLVKSKGEIRAMTRAMEISGEAHIRAMSACRPGMTEYEIEAELNYEFMRAGSRRAAYPSIVAGGANACVLHYVENRDTLRDGDLLLIDAGAEYDYYASDITRTFPVNGRFTRAQRALYDVVLEAQEAAIEKVQPGNHWNEPHEAAVEVLAEGLVALGLIKGRASAVIKKGRYRKFYVHRTGHWLGMDVHDVGDYKIEGEWRVLEPGMVMTVEPGLYVAPGDKQVARKWWNTGIRIEDDVLVTRTGNKVLTAAAPKAADDIEAIVGQG